MTNRTVKQCIVENTDVHWYSRPLYTAFGSHESIVHFWLAQSISSLFLNLLTLSALISDVDGLLQITAMKYFLKSQWRTNRMHLLVVACKHLRNRWVKCRVRRVKKYVFHKQNYISRLTSAPMLNAMQLVSVDICLSLSCSLHLGAGILIWRSKVIRTGPWKSERETRKTHATSPTSPILVNVAYVVMTAL